MDQKNNPYLIFTISFLTVVFGAMNSVLSSAYLPDILRHLKGNSTNEEAAIIGAWINCSFLAGGTLGGIAFGFLSDRIGRRKAFLSALLFYSAGSALGASVNNWQSLVATRFFVGVGVGTALVISAVVLSEIWSARTKAIALGILSVAYPVGIMASGVITSTVPDWRTAFIIGAGAILLVIPAWYLVPETYKKDNAIKTNVAPPEYRNNLVLGILIYGTMLIGLWSTFSWLPTWVESLLTSNATEGQSLRGLAVTLLGIGGLLGSIVSGWLGNRFGLRTIQGVCFVLCFALSLWMFRLSNTLSIEILIGCALLGLCFGISQGVLNTFIPELFPSRLRSSATGLCFHTGRAFTAIAVFFVGAWAVWLGGYGNAIFVFSWAYLLGLVALIFINPQTTS